MSLDANTWYSIQSFGTDYNLAVSNDTVNSQSDGTAANALWQASTQSYLRNKLSGKTLCLANTNGQVSMAPCSGTTVWTVAPFNGQNAGEGYYIASGGTSGPRLNEAETGNAVSVRDYTGPSNNDVYFQWAFRSVSAINDASFSGGGNAGTTSTGSSGGSGSGSATSSTGASAGMTTTSADASSGPGSASSSAVSTVTQDTLTITRTVTPTTGPAPSVTSSRVVTSSSGTRSASSTTVSPTSVPGNGASGKHVSLSNVLLVFALVESICVLNCL